jgi:hypothetical protein
VDPPPYVPGPLPVTAAENALWQQVHTGPPGIREQALRDLATVRGSQPPGGTEIGVRDALHSDLSQRPEVRLVSAGNSPAAQIDTDDVRRALDSFGVPVTVEAPRSGGTAGTTDGFGGTSTGARAETPHRQEPTGHGVETVSPETVSPDTISPDAGSPDAGSPGPAMSGTGSDSTSASGSPGAGPGGVPAGGTSAAPSSSTPSQGSPQTPDAARPDGDALDGRGLRDEADGAAEGKPGAVSGPANGPTGAAPLTVVVSESPPPAQGSPEAAALLDGAGADRAVVLGPPLTTDGMGRPVRAAAELTREGPGHPVEVRPLTGPTPAAPNDTGGPAGTAFPGSDVLLPLADAVGSPASAGRASRPATESDTAVDTPAPASDTGSTSDAKPFRTESAPSSADPSPTKVLPEVTPPARSDATEPDASPTVPPAAKLATLSRPWAEPATEPHLESGSSPAPLVVPPPQGGIVVRPVGVTGDAGSGPARPPGQPVVTTLTGHTVPVAQLRRWVPEAGVMPQPGRAVRTLTVSQSPAEDGTPRSEDRRTLLGQDTYRGVRTVSDPGTVDVASAPPRTVFTGPPAALPGSGTEAGADYFTAHGTPRTVTLGTDDTAHPSVKVSGVQFGEVLKSWSGDGAPDRPIVLFSCETGRQPAVAGLPVAQHVANRTGRPVYAPTTEVGTARDSDGNVRAVLTEGPDGPGRWRLFTPEPGGTDLDDLARVAGLHAGPEPADAFTRARTLQQIRTLRDTLGTDAEQRPENHELLAGLALVDNLRWLSPSTAARYGDGRMTPDLLRRMVTDWDNSAGGDAASCAPPPACAPPGAPTPRSRPCCPRRHPCSRRPPWSRRRTCAD